MFRVKICGITNVDDALAAIDAGADAIGLNFYATSPRSVALHQAAQISDAVRGRAQCIGVFVNHDQQQIATVCQAVGLDGVQLHGDETPELVAALSNRPSSERVASKNEPSPQRSLIRARRMTEDGTSELAADLAACRSAGGVPDALLVDAYTPNQYGGSGATLQWDLFADYRQWLGELPLILAGGLTPENVADAISIVGPHGVDVASGIESSPGKKNAAKVGAFVSKALAALRATS